jgi:cytochrome c553
MATLRAIVVVRWSAARASAALAQTGAQLYQQWCQGCHGAPASNEKNVLAGKEWSYIKLAMDTVPQMNDVLRPVYDDGLLTDDDFIKVAAYLQTFTGGTTSTLTPVVEYYNAGFGHYFMTADDDEITGLDAGAFDYAFLRTGPRVRRLRVAGRGHGRGVPVLHDAGHVRQQELALLHGESRRVRRAQAQSRVGLREDRVLQRACRRTARARRHDADLPDVQQRPDRRAEPPLHQRPFDLPGVHDVAELVARGHRVLRTAVAATGAEGSRRSCCSPGRTEPMALAANLLVTRLRRSPRRARSRKPAAALQQATARAATASPAITTTAS